MLFQFRTNKHLSGSLYLLLFPTFQVFSSVSLYRITNQFI